MNEYTVFPITVFGEIVPYSDTISRARVSIFYKGHNRNGSYISEEFAEKLIQTLPYAPIKGIYSYEDGDYTNHLQNLSDDESYLTEKIYGVIPTPMNFAWEKRLDEDGVEREYACADVVLWTGLHQEAKEIVGKPQSMELYRPSIKGEWTFVDGARSFKFEDAAFLGLQVLGDNTIPAFEGATFYELDELHSFLTNYTQKLEKALYRQGEELMEKDKVLTGEETIEVIEETPVLEHAEVEEPEVVIEAKEDSSEETPEVVVADEENPIESVEFSAEEIAEMQKELEELRNKNSEFEAEIVTLKQEKGELESQLSSNENELSELREFKLAIDVAEKESILDRYSEILDAEILNTYKESLSDYTAEELDKELAHEYVRVTPDVFSGDKQYFPKGEQLSGLEAILTKYIK